MNSFVFKCVVFFPQIKLQCSDEIARKIAKNNVATSSNNYKYCGIYKVYKYYFVRLIVSSFLNSFTYKRVCHETMTFKGAVYDQSRLSTGHGIGVLV